MFLPTGQAVFGSQTSQPSVDLVRILLDAGAPLEVRTLAGNTPLHIAAYKGYVSIVEFLLARGADREARNAQGQTPAMLAVLYKQLTVVRMLSAPPAQ